jgi:L,D-transpeptidase ErfK/SrfK
MPSSLNRRDFCRLAVGATLAAALPRGVAAQTAPGDGDVVGAMGFHFATRGETLLDIARANDLGILELMAANPGVDPWVPGDGVPVVLPSAFVLPDAPREGIVINLAELRIYYFRRKGEPKFQTRPIGIGREGFTTPLGQTTIVRKQKDPVWRPTASTRADRPELPEAVPPGPDNPMGAYALYLGWPTYAMHGTNQPWGVGRRVSRGCIRMYPEDVEAIYPQVPIGTRVTVVDQPVKLGWHMGELYLEAQPSLSQLDQLEEHERFLPAAPMPELQEMIIAAAGSEAHRINWPEVARIENERRGVPLQITLPYEATGVVRQLDSTSDGEL